ncbi:MAG: serine dehydratase subunit alpha family protein [Clostridiales bacterium]|nr:serine dehydratase subunit alpha family protein [Clostridiales bacterium]
MNTKEIVWKVYTDILNQELIPAMGCTEPIALAYCAAKARDVLGGMPDRVEIGVSGNIIKNVKSVIVPNTDGLKGIEAAAAAGIVGGNADRVLEVIAEVTPEQKSAMRDFLAGTPVAVTALDETAEKLDIIVTLYASGDSAKVRIAKYHTNIVLIEKNHTVLYQEGVIAADDSVHQPDKGLLNVQDILEFAENCDIAPLSGVIQRQLDYNYAIAKEGIENDWGANVGSVLLSAYGDDVKTRARAWAAAGSDARMSGCELPVIINSGSGNQGITTALPVLVYARELGVSAELLHRAMILTDLIAVHLKTGIGPLSAYCGAITAGCAAGCGVAYLQEKQKPGADIFSAIAHTLVNSLAIVSGIVCDGAKPSCAAKIASAVDAGILGYEMYIRGQQFYGGEGIVSKGVENTIHNVGRLGADGMRETDREIIRIMVGTADSE